MKNTLFVLVILFPLMSLARDNGGGSPSCDGMYETKVSWPTDNPIFELCYVPPNRSTAAQGSSLEIRDVYFNGYYAIERSHIPILFAEYNNGTCYRDWKNTNANFLFPDAEESPSRPAITTCDASTSQTNEVLDCPFRFLNPDGTVGSGSQGSASDCDSGVTVEKYDDRMVLTTNHSADWYKYASKYTFYIDGRIAPRFGFGNSTGTLDDVTHFHHAYWRINFDIDGSDHDQVFIGKTIQTTEFSDMRSQSENRNWSVKDSVTGRGYRVEASAEDYLVVQPTTGAGYHPVDVMTTKYRLINEILTEYSDTPGQNNLLECGMEADNLVNGETIENEDVVFWYRAAVRDLADIGLVCKYAGPVFYPIGDWGLDDPQLIYKNGFESQ